MKRVVLIVLALALMGVTASAEQKERLYVVTGGTGGVYYPLGGAVANVRVAVVGAMKRGILTRLRLPVWGG